MDNTEKIFNKYDEMEITRISPTVNRRMSYLNNLMVTIVDIDGPMSEPDPVHSHEAEQICYIAEGECIVFIGDKQMAMKAGDIFAVPSNVPHAIQALSKKLRLIDSFNPIREDFIKK